MRSLAVHTPSHRWCLLCAGTVLGTGASPCLKELGNRGPEPCRKGLGEQGGLHGGKGL